MSDGKDIAHQLNLGYLLYEVSLEQNTDIILKYAEKWLKKYPGNQLVEYMAGAIVGKQKRAALAGFVKYSTLLLLNLKKL